MDFEELKYRLKYFFEDYGKYVLAVGIVIGAILVLLIINKAEDIQENGKEEKETLGQALELDDKRVEDLNRTFSLLSESDIQSPNAKNKVLSVSLYLKTPFMPKKDFEDEIHKLVDAYKYRYNDDKKGTFISYIDIQVYTRALDYYMGLEGEHSAQYLSDKLTDKKEKELRKREKNMEKIHLSVVYYENALELVKKPNYDDYIYQINYRAKNDTASPYSDEEYAFFMKLQQYLLLTQNNLDNAIKLYLEWEYGLVVNKIGRHTSAQFSNFLERENELNNGVETRPLVQRYNGDYIEFLYIDNPSLVLYSKTGYTAKNNIQAMKLLVKLFPSQFKELYFNYLLEADEIANEEELETTKEEIDQLSQYLKEMADIDIDSLGEEELESRLEEGNQEKEIGVDVE